jgi:carbonic anhydrase
MEGMPFKSSQHVRLQELLPDKLDYFYRYAGSLTTPHCDESVVWTVLTHLMPIGEQQVISGHAKRKLVNPPFKLSLGSSGLEH